MKNKKVLIFGLGLNQGGVGSTVFFAKQGAEIKVTDLKSEKILKLSLNQLKKYKNISYTLGEHKYEDIDWADIIIRNPAIKDNNPYLKYALEKGKKVETDFSIFLNFADKKKMIAVTGTKGKSTTASLIYEILKTAGRKVVFAGNIGKSILDTVPYLAENPWIVVEISSFQLQALKDKNFAPYIAIITNIYPDHLNWHTSMEEYIKAKKLIAIYQTENDYLFLRKDDPITIGEDFLSGIKAKIIYYSKNDLPKDFHPKLLGEHNLENIAAAFAISKTLDLASQVNDPGRSQALQVLKDFSGVEFRLQLIYNEDGIKIYNDTAATSPDAGIKALETFPDCVLICGGMNKKMDYTKYASVIKEKAKKVYFLEGDATDEIKKKLDIKKTYNNLEKLLIDVKKEIKPGDIILFSPAATSFNLFQNEFDRGRKFNAAVKKVFG